MQPTSFEMRNTVKIYILLLALAAVLSLYLLDAAACL